MARIYMKSSADVQTVIDNLTNLLISFNQKALDIDAEHSALTSKWQGDASTEFHDHFLKERDNFITMSEAVKEYIEALQKIKASIEVAEDRNKVIANS